MTTDSYVTTLVSGQLMINGKSTDEEYEISKTKTSLKLLNIPWWRSHPIHENRATQSIWTEPCNPLLRATKSTKRATSIYEMTLIFYYLIVSVKFKGGTNKLLTNI